MDSTITRFTELYNTISVVLYALNNIEVKGAVNMGNLYNSIQQLEGVIKVLHSVEDSLKSAAEKTSEKTNE